MEKVKDMLLEALKYLSIIEQKYNWKAFIYFLTT